MKTLNFWGIISLIHCLVVHEANIQDRDGALLLFKEKSAVDFPRMQKLWLDSGYAGRCKKWLEEKFTWDVEIVRRLREGNRGIWCPIDQDPPPLMLCFQVVKRRWVVERTFGCFRRWRRLSKDYETTPKTSETMVYVAMVGLMLRRLAL